MRIRFMNTQTKPLRKTVQIELSLISGRSDDGVKSMVEQILERSLLNNGEFALLIHKLEISETKKEQI